VRRELKEKGYVLKVLMAAKAATTVKATRRRKTMSRCSEFKE
jgi:uncharacterized membrane protein YiaA